jgi:hypothetical protein
VAPVERTPRAGRRQDFSYRRCIARQKLSAEITSSATPSALSVSSTAPGGAKMCSIDSALSPVSSKRWMIESAKLLRS